MKRFIRFGLAILFFIALLPLISGLSQPLHAQGFSDAKAGSGTIPSTGTGACSFLKDGNQSLCKTCFDGGGAWTAFGCVGKGGNPSDFISNFLKLSISIGGGIAFLLILVSGFQTMTSTGNPEKLHAAKELLGGAISGLLLIIFSIFILKIIGVDILGIPGFSSGSSDPLMLVK